jgi:hypothetical protein
VLSKKQKKAIYDKKYRKLNRARIKANHAAYFQRTYDPVEAAKKRKKRMPEHEKTKLAEDEHLEKLKTLQDAIDWNAVEVRIG